MLIGFFCFVRSFFMFFAFVCHVDLFHGLFRVFNVFLIFDFVHGLLCSYCSCDWAV